MTCFVVTVALQSSSTLVQLKEKRKKDSALGHTNNKIFKEKLAVGTVDNLPSSDFSSGIKELLVKLRRQKVELVAW